MMQKGDFTAGIRLLWIAALAIVIGALCAFVALALLWLIGLFTHLFYFPGEFKVARRGFHVSREYSVDPLELLSIEEVMTKDVVTVPASLPVGQLLRQYFLGDGRRPHQAYPVVDETGRLLGVVTRTNLLEDWIAAALTDSDGDRSAGLEHIITYDLIHREPITVYPWESCRAAAERMAENGVGRLPVVSPDDPGKVIGIVTRSDLLKPRAKTVEEEVRRERLIRR
jgi:CBS domain-containing protein